MHWALLAVLAFVVTIVETYISSKTTQAIAEQRKVHASNWNTLFEAVLLVDILLIVANWRVVVLPILLGAWLGMYYSFNRRPEGG